MNKTNFKMRNSILISCLTIAFLIGCERSKKKSDLDSTDSINAVQTESQAQKNKDDESIGPVFCDSSQSLIYSNSSFSSYTEDQMRGAGVVSFQLAINDRLDIYYLDEASFGFLVYNESETFYLLSMPRKLVARRVVPEADFAEFDFDAEPVETDDRYLFIYANGEKLMVRKADVKYTFNKWDDYLRLQNVKLKPCNLLADAAQHREMLFEVTELEGNRMKIRSSKGCSGGEVDFKQVEGWIRWKEGNSLLVDVGACY